MIHRFQICFLFNLRHFNPVPPEFDASQPLLWKWFDRMLDEISRSNLDALPASVSLPALRAEVSRMADAVRCAEGGGLQIVLAHGKAWHIFLATSSYPPWALIS
jgi:hypothetical protein